jgi:hypothetical protein
MTIRDAALLGLSWHAALVMIIDGIAREDYHDLVALLRNVPPCIGRSWDDIRDALKPFARRRTSPFGAAFALWWKASRSRSRSGGTRYKSNAQVDLLGRAEWIAGVAILGLALHLTASSAASLPPNQWGVLLGVFAWANLAGLSLLPAARVAIRRQATIRFGIVALVFIVEFGSAAAGGTVGSLLAGVLG